MPEVCELLTCLFCLNLCIPSTSGKINCPICDAAYEIDDSGECVFGDIDNIKLPAVGTICAECGLIQAGENENCLYCGIEINATLH